MPIRVAIDADHIILPPVLTDPPLDTHKYRRGHLVVMSGPALHTGASRLAAQAGLAVGAGLVTLVGEHDALIEHAAHVTAIMLRPRGTATDLAGMRTTSVVCGPGAGRNSAMASMLLNLAGQGVPIVIDADGLTSFADDSAALFAIATPQTVLTPHEGEFARLFSGIALDDRVTAAREAALLSGAVVVLKGSQTVVAEPGRRFAINRHASPWLATAGSGDVLAGMIGGLLAGGMGAFDAACAAVWLHGDIGVRAGPGLTADAMPGMIPVVLRGVWQGEVGRREVGQGDEWSG
jgi:ADP-dependent NAD(P)H-hydrate dehydratase / NAD(P)H-hydrate epimerase